MLLSQEAPKTLFHTSKPEWVPHEYQKRAIAKMISQACVGLFLDPGLGKTACSLAAFKILRDQGYVKRMLVIAPLRPCYSVWPGEIRKWHNFSDLKFAILHGEDRRSLLDEYADVFIMNVENVKWLFRDDLHKRFKPDILCIDESSKFRHSNTERFKGIKKKLNDFKRRWILTGTPAPNGLMDLWGQMYLLDQGASLEPYVTRFKMKYFYQTGFSGYTFSPFPTALAEITSKTDPLVIRLKSADYLDMPDLQFQNIEVDLPKDARETYRKMEDDFFAELQTGEVVAVNQAVAGGKCRQIANGRVYDAERGIHIVHEAKLAAFEDLVGELSGQPVLVAYEFKHDLEAMLSRVKGPVLGSGTSAAKSEKIIESFNAGEIPVLYGHPASVGHGLNLQEAAHHVCFYGIPWDLELYDQTISRICRQGQKAEKVFVYHIVAKDTVDETVLSALAQKDRTQRTLLEAFTNDGMDRGRLRRDAGPL